MYETAESVKDSVLCMWYIIAKKWFRTETTNRTLVLCSCEACGRIKLSGFAKYVSSLPCNDSHLQLHYFNTTMTVLY